MKVTNSHRLAHLACAVVDSFRVKVGVILEREKEKKKQIMMKKKETKAEERENYIKLNKQRQTRYKIM